MAAKKKKYSGKKPMGVKEAAKKTRIAKEDLARFRPEPRYSTIELVRKNTRGGKLSLEEKLLGVDKNFLSKTEKKAAKVMQARREGERTRTASRAKGIAKRQTKVVKARRAKKALGN